MNLTNNTRLNLTSCRMGEQRYLITEVFYDLTHELSLNKTLTYGQIFAGEIENSQPEKATLLALHDLSDKQIQHAHAQVQSTKYPPQQARTLSQNINHWIRLKKTKPETRATFRLPPLAISQAITIGIHQSPPTKIQINSVSWTIAQTQHYRKEIISPLIQGIHYYHHKKQVSALLFYPVSDEAFITVTQGDSHAAS